MILIAAPLLAYVLFKLQSNLHLPIVSESDLEETLQTVSELDKEEGTLQTISEAEEEVD